MSKWNSTKLLQSYKRKTIFASYWRDVEMSLPNVNN